MSNVEQEAGWILPIVLALLSITGIFAGTLYVLIRGNQVHEQYVESSVIAKELAVSGIEYWIARSFRAEFILQDGQLTGVGPGGTYTASGQILDSSTLLNIQSSGSSSDGAQSRIQVEYSLLKHKIITWRQQP